jgi:hypothetical protein
MVEHNTRAEDGSNWPGTSRLGPPSYRALTRQGLKDHPAPDDNGGARERSSPVTKHSGGGGGAAGGQEGSVMGPAGRGAVEERTASTKGEMFGLARWLTERSALAAVQRHSGA